MPLAVSGTAPPERSVSSSRQFIVYGADNRLRGAVCDAAERSKRAVLRLLDVSDLWKTPIVIQAQPLSADPAPGSIAQLHVSQTGAGLKFQLELRISAVVSVPDIERELLRAIFLEMMYRDQPDTPAGTPYVEPPDWLLEGSAALAPQGDADSLAQILGTASERKTLTLEEFLRQKRALLESPSQGVYRAYSAAFVSMLVESPDGRRQLARFLADLVNAPNDPVADLRTHFPGLGENIELLEKTWQMRVARFGRGEPFHLLTYEETEHELAELLRVKILKAGSETSYGLEEFAQFLREPATHHALEGLTTQLRLLTARANPLYRPVISEYDDIVGRLLKKKTRRLPERLAKLRATRELLSREMSEIADYMNWFEATQARSVSGTFRGYLRAAGAVEVPQPRRHDPVSVYLDALEAQF